MSSSLSYTPRQKDEVQSSIPPPTASENPSSSYDEQANDLGTANSIKSEQSRRDPVYSMRKAPQAPRGMIRLMKTLLLPLVAIAYLTFCYTVHNRVVPITSNTSADIASIKSGITSISIIIIAIGLWPLKDLIENIKSEEFFRTLHTHPSVPFAEINGISIPSFGMFDTILASTHRHCSPYLTLAFFAALLSIATSTLAPAALSVETILIDTDIMAFKVGSVGADSVFNVTSVIPFKTDAVYTNSELSALIAWAETSLGLRYSFTQQAGVVSPYIVPPLVDLDLGATARWLTDVVALHPTCVWSKTNVSGTLDYRPSNLSTTPDLNETKTIFLSDVGVDLMLSSSFSLLSPSIQMLKTEYRLLNHTNQGLLSDGSIGWQVGQCVSGICQPSIRTAVTYNFTGIPTIQIVGADMTWEVAYLVCSPRPMIETREARSDPQGILSVHGDKKYTKQGNLHPGQMGLLLSFSIADFADKSGPSLSVGFMGSKAQAALIFGNDQINTINTTQGAFTITPLENHTIADSYVRVLQSTTNFYLGGKLGTAYVPGRLSKPALVFRSSMGYAVVSTALFALLTLFIIWAHFRAGQDEQFTLFRIILALYKSEIPSRFEQMRREAGEARGMADAGHEEEVFIREYGNLEVTYDDTLHFRDGRSDDSV